MSNLDAEAERDLHTVLRRVASGRTTVLIAHRPSTMRLADRIIVLEHGRVAQIGTYDELLEYDGPSADFCANARTHQRLDQVRSPVGGSGPRAQATISLAADNFVLVAIDTN